VDLLIAIPLKPFGVAKARLAPVLSAGQRSRLGRTVAARTVAVATETGARVAVVTGDPEVSDWAVAQGAEVIAETGTGGLNAAASAAVVVALSEGRGWAILHADLPLLAFEELRDALARWRPGDTVLAPTYDGGTSLLVGDVKFPFAYGPGSFHRHLRLADGRAEIVVRRGLALDMDTPRDLQAALQINPRLADAWNTVRT